MSHIAKTVYYNYVAFISFLIAIQAIEHERVARHQDLTYINEGFRIPYLEIL